MVSRSREFGRDEPAQLAFHGIGFELDEGDASLGHFRVSSRELENRVREIGLVTDNHEALAGKAFKDFSELGGIEPWAEERFGPDFHVQVFACDLGRLTRARERTGEDNGGDFETGQSLRHGRDFFFSFIRQGTLIIRLRPVRPVSLSMAEQIKLH